jgi:Bacterial Ig-like domain (group 2)
MSRLPSVRFAVIALALVSAVACSGGDSPSGPITPTPTPTPTPTVQSVVVSPATATLVAAGATTALTSDVRLSNGTSGSQTVTWTPPTPTFPTVSTTGVVTAVASGSTTVTAAVGAVTGTATITVAIPFVQSITVTPATNTLASFGATTPVTAAVLMSNGVAGTQTPTWTSSNPAVATVSAGTVTAVSNGSATITATVGTVTGTAVVTVAQVVASVRLLPTDTVMKTAGALRASALDARGNVIANAPIVWTAVNPGLATVSQSGAVTPLNPGVARMRVSSGAFQATSIVRSIANIVRLSDMTPLFEYTASAGQRRAYSEISQSNADARAILMGQVWNYLETVFPSSGTASTDMFFSTWPEIWLEASPFCGGTLFANQDVYQVCTSPTWTHWVVPTGSDFYHITRWLSRQFLLSSMTRVAEFPWFLGGYTQWLAGGSFQGAAIAGSPLRANIQDFRTGDTQGLLVPIDTLVRTANARFFENLPQRTPVAVRQAQSALFLAYLNRDYPLVIPAILARIRATPGNAFTNDMLIAEIQSRTGRTLAQLEPGYLIYARSLQP